MKTYKGRSIKHKHETKLQHFLRTGNPGDILAVTTLDELNHRSLCQCNKVEVRRGYE